MRTFEKKPQASQCKRSAKSALPHWGHSGHCHEANSILHLPQGIGDPAMQQILDRNTAVVQGGCTATEISCLGHDFSRIPVHPSEPFHTVSQRRPPALHSSGAGNEASAPSPLSVSEAAREGGEQQETAHGTAPATTTAASAATTLRWQHVKRHRWDALWFFCGEHPSGFSTTATLRAEGYTEPANVEWFVRSGSDKVYAPGGFNGAEITLHSSAGSQRPDDVQIEVQERRLGGAIASYLGRLTVRKPHRLRMEGTSDNPSCPPGNPNPGFWSQITYRILDNVSGTIIGATVNERFPGPAVNDQPNNWSGAAVVTASSWPGTNGTFTDNLFKCGGNPVPVLPGSRQWSDRVFHEPHEFYVGSTISGRGCRVQVHTLQFYRGFADHESIRSPAP